MNNQSVGYGHWDRSHVCLFRLKMADVAGKRFTFQSRRVTDETHCQQTGYELRQADRMIRSDIHTRQVKLNQ